MSDVKQSSLHEHITATFRQFCSEMMLTIITLGIDKHGSFVWEAGAYVYQLNRFLILGITEVAADGKQAEMFSESMVIGADDGWHYVAYTMRSLRFKVPMQPSSLDRYRSRLRRRLIASWERARQISENELVQRYIMPREPTLSEPRSRG